MPQSSTLATLDAIIGELETAFQQVAVQIQSLPDTTYLTRADDDKWSPAENLEHLLLSTYPVIGAMGKGPEFFNQFGEPQHAEIEDYAGLKAYYGQVLQTGIKAPAKFVPEFTKVYQKAEHLAQWEAVGVQLREGCQSWSEKDLDQKAIPHPAMGLISVRQMLYFTILHTYHHLETLLEAI